MYTANGWSCSLADSGPSFLSAQFLNDAVDPNAELHSTVWRLFLEAEFPVRCLYSDITVQYLCTVASWPFRCELVQLT